MSVRRQVSEIAKKSTNPGLRRGYLAEDWDGIGNTVPITLSRGSSSAVQAFIAAGAFGTEQIYPAGTPLFVLEAKGQLEVVSLGSKLSAGALTLPMLPTEGLDAGQNDGTVLSGDVQLDSTGLLIKNGKLIIQDEWGQVVAGASGFSGGWGDFLVNGLYNSCFEFGGLTILPDGRTNYLPYWDVLNGSSSTLTREVNLNYPSGYRIKYIPGGIGSDYYSYITTDPVQIIGGRTYAISYLREITRVAGDLSLQIGVDWYDAADEYIDTSLGGNETFQASDVLGQCERQYTGQSPITARYARVFFCFQEDTSHNSGNRIYVGSVTFQPIIPITAVMAIGPWYLASTASLTDQPMKYGDSAILGTNLVHIPWDYSVVGVGIRNSSSRTNGTATATVWINSSPTLLEAQLTTGVTDHKETTAVHDLYTGLAGEEVNVRLTTSVAWTPTTGYATAWIYVAARTQ